jgi:hypothetical protein
VEGRIQRLRFRGTKYPVQDPVQLTIQLPANTERREDFRFALGVYRKI